MRQMLMACACMALWACSVAPPVSNYQPSRGDIAFPEIGAVTEVGLGEDMISQGQFTESRGIALKDEVRVDRLEVHPGFYPQIGEDEAYSYLAYRTAPTGEGFGYIPPARDGLGSWLPAPDAVRVAKAGEELCLIYTSLGTRPCRRGVAYEPASKLSLTDQDLQQKLIYAGRSDDMILLKYWEKSGNSARPENTEELTFEYRPDGEIGYKGARLRILSAGPTTVRYIALQNFPSFWTEPRVEPVLTRP